MHHSGKILRGVVALAALAAPLCAQVPAAAPAPGVTIVLPPRVVGGAPATLAVLGLDGHLVPNITVQISTVQSDIAPVGARQYATTDATGRATFTAPSAGAVIAQAAGASAAAIVDASAPAAANQPLSIAPAVSLRDRFAICGSGFSGNASANRVTANGDATFVLAASPECVVALPQPRTLYGAAKIEIESGGTHASATTSLVALDFLPPNPPLVPGQESSLTVRAEGTADALRIVVENRSPDALSFIGGDMQEQQTSGGASNQAQVNVKAIRSGDFSFRARLLPAPDPGAAVRYLSLAADAAPKSQRGQLKKISTQLSRSAKDSAKALRDLDRIAAAIPPGPLRTLLDAARSSL
jgi:hypothetical protein